MIWVALRMLTGDRVKYVGLVVGVAFSTLLCVHLASIFMGVIGLASYLVIANPSVDVWVMRKGVDATDWVDQMPQAWMDRVKGVQGVAWATPLYRGSTMIRTADGLRVVQIIGVDDTSLIGAPADMISGMAESLREPDSVVLDIATFKRIFPDLDVHARPSLEMGKRYVRVAGVCRAVRSITGGDIVYARRGVAANLAQEPNNTVTFVLVKSDGSVSGEALAARIQAQTGLVARSKAQFRKSIVGWTLENTGIVEVLGSVIVLGLVVGILVVGQTFYMFANENAKYFATFKAMGAGGMRIAAMLVAQALLVSLVGYGLGLGVATMLLRAGNTDLSTMRGLTLSAPVALTMGLLMPLLVVTTALIGSRKVLSARAGVVFQ